MSNTEKENPDSIKSEKCILCGKDTGIPFNEPIDKRKYYIRGSGQLCGNCYYALYIQRTEDESRFTEEEMNALLQLCRENHS